MAFVQFIAMKSYFKSVTTVVLNMPIKTIIRVLKKSHICRLPLYGRIYIVIGSSNESIFWKDILRDGVSTKMVDTAK